MTSLDRYRGFLPGLAVRDAVRTTLEFQSPGSSGWSTTLSATARFTSTPVHELVPYEGRRPSGRGQSADFRLLHSVQNLLLFLIVLGLFDQTLIEHPFKLPEFKDRTILSFVGDFIRLVA